MKSMLVLLLAALLPAATWAQTATSAGPNTQTQSRQGVGMQPGSRLCGHVMDAGTIVDARAQNASGEEALVIRWLDLKSNAIHSALVMGRCVAKDGDTIDGKVIIWVLPNSLAVSNQHGRVGWEAEFRYMYGPLGNGPSRRGVFDQDRFVAELDASKASKIGSADVTAEARDFRWNEQQEKLEVEPGVLPPSPNYTYTYVTPPPGSPQAANPQPTPAQAPATQPCIAVPAKQGGVMGRLKKHLERTLEGQAAQADAQIGKATGGKVDPGVADATTTAINQANQQNPCTPAGKGQGAKQ